MNKLIVVCCPTRWDADYYSRSDIILGNFKDTELLAEELIHIIDKNSFAMLVSSNKDAVATADVLISYFDKSQLKCERVKFKQECAKNLDEMRNLIRSYKNISNTLILLAYTRYEEYEIYRFMRYFTKEEFGISQSESISEGDACVIDMERKKIDRISIPQWRTPGGSRF